MELLIWRMNIQKSSSSVGDIRPLQQGKETPDFHLEFIDLK